MKVCFIGSDLTYKGGIQNLSSNLIIHMSHEPKIDEISVMCDVIDEEVFKLIKQDKLKIQCMGRSKKGDLPRIISRNVKFGSSFRELDSFDIIHVLDDRALPIITPNDKRLVVTVHDVMLQELFIQVKNIASGGLGHLPNFMDHYCPQLFLDTHPLPDPTKLSSTVQLLLSA